MNPFKIKRLFSGGIITNYFCTSRCRHCLYNAGPYRKKQYIDPDTAKENFQIVRRMGCTAVHIGGGEPLLKPRELGNVLEIAARVGVSIEYVETNASWFKDLDSAKNILFELRQKGLRTILVSISPFHNEFIPFSKTRGVMEAAKMAGIGVFPWVTDFISDLSQFDPERTHTIDTYQKKFGNGYLQQVLNRYWIHMGGRALETFRPILPNRSARQILEAHPEGCAKELSNATHFHIDLFGNYIPGLCTGLSISTSDLDKPLSENKYPVVTTLVRSGIRGNR